MKLVSRLLSTAGLLVLTAACSRSPASRADHPRLTPNVHMQDFTFYSASLQRQIPYRVILPLGLLKSQKLPVVYLLHGGDGGYKDWSNYSDVAQFAEHGLILVMPEGNSSYYMNAAERPQDRYEDYVARDLITEIESRFPAASGRGSRAIVGISMGGFGAVTLALKHPDLFAFVGGISSALDVPTRQFSLRRISQYRAHAKIFGPWGSETRRANNPYILAASVDPKNAPYFFLTCGEQEGLFPANRRFATLLQKQGFKYEFESSTGGHDWNQWNRRLPEVFHSMEEHTAAAVKGH